MELDNFAEFTFENDPKEEVHYIKLLKANLHNSHYPLRLEYINRKIKQLQNQQKDTDSNKEEIIKLSKEYSVLTKYTSFV